MSVRRALLAGVAALLLTAAPPAAGAQEGGPPDAGGTVPSQPQVVVEPAAVAPGDAVVLTMTGFRARNVTVTVCGNAAARGSVDCNQSSGEGIALREEVTRRELVVPTPPTPCPCVVRVASRTQDEVAIAPVELAGHPGGEVIRSDTSRLVDVFVEARRTPDGLIGQLRSALGGPTEYEIEVVVHNRSGLPLEGLAVSASARTGGAESRAVVELPFLGLLAAGETWSHTATATMPAPVIGSVVWQVTVSGAGPVVADASSSRSVPYLLLVLIAVLVGDLVALVMRRRSGRRLRSRLGAVSGVRPA